MKKNNSYHLDNSVIFLFLATFLVSASVLGYKYSSYEPCKDINYDITGSTYTVGKIIRFNDKTEGAENWRWDFGDKSSGSFLKNTIHAYTKPGEYKVKLVINSSCELVKTIKIKKGAIVKDTKKYPVFELPSKDIFVGETLTLNDKTPNAKSWEWRFGESGKLDSNKKMGEYTYEEEGEKVISLIVNGDVNFITKKRILIKPKAPIKDDTDPFNIKVRPDDMPLIVKDRPDELPPMISKSDFKDKLIKYSKEKITVDDLAYYICGNNVHMRVMVKGREMSFSKLCNKISGKLIKIKKMELTWDKQSGCINHINLDYKRSIL